MFHLFIYHITATGVFFLGSRGRYITGTRLSKSLAFYMGAGARRLERTWIILEKGHLLSAAFFANGGVGRRES